VETMLDMVTTIEMYTASGAFEQERYQRATKMLDKCSQTGLFKKQYDE
jgi:hypothetical protein